MSSEKSIHTDHIEIPVGPTTPARHPIYLSSVHFCPDAQVADGVLGGEIEGFAYRRDAHANQHVLGERCRMLHQADFASLTSSGMAALSLALLATLRTGDRVLISEQLYGKTTTLFSQHAARLGIESDIFDPTDLDQLSDKFDDRTKLVVVETISNPLMVVTDLPTLAEQCHRNGALLLVDNTFASPSVCQPLELGADLVMESMTKIMNGHSDVLMGLLCGRERVADAKLGARVDDSLRTWGMVAAPFDCWLADRGIGTMELRVAQACHSTMEIARELERHPQVARVHYPGLESASSASGNLHRLSRQQFVKNSLPGSNEDTRFGYMLSFELPDGRAAVDRFVVESGLRFCPSLGDLSTTLSHPLSTSHRGLSEAACKKQGITEGLLRISVGIEPTGFLVQAVINGLNGLDAT